MLYRGVDGELTGVSPRGYGILTQPALRAIGGGVALRSSKVIVHVARSISQQMAEEKRVLVKLGDSNRPVSFVSDGENDQDIVIKEIRKVYHDEIPENSSFILQMKDEEWGGEFVDISPSQTNIASRSILKVIVKKVSFNTVNHLYLLLVKFMFSMHCTIQSESTQVLPSPGNNQPCCSHSSYQVNTLSSSIKI